MILDSNHLPEVSEEEAAGYWERIVILPFQDTLPPEKRNDNLKDSIVSTELDNILTFLVNESMLTYLEYVHQKELNLEVAKPKSEISEKAKEYYMFLNTPYDHCISKAIIEIIPELGFEDYRFYKRETFKYFLQYINKKLSEYMHEFKWGDITSLQQKRQIKIYERTLGRKMQLQGYFDNSDRNGNYWENAYILISECLDKPADFLIGRDNLIRDIINNTDIKAIKEKLDLFKTLQIYTTNNKTRSNEPNNSNQPSVDANIDQTAEHNETKMAKDTTEEKSKPNSSLDNSTIDNSTPIQNISANSDQDSLNKNIESHFINNMFLDNRKQESTNEELGFQIPNPIENSDEYDFDGTTKLRPFMLSPFVNT